MHNFVKLFSRFFFALVASLLVAPHKSKTKEENKNYKRVKEENLREKKLPSTSEHTNKPYYRLFPRHKFLRKIVFTKTNDGTCSLV
jgi:wobble nucleotide-excising tRNase